MSQKKTDAELQALLEWNPPRLFKGSRASPSKSTRQPSLYDKHIREDLILKEVWPLPSLHHDIAAVVDRTLKAIANEGITLPPREGVDILTAEQRDDHDFLCSREPMLNKYSVINFYEKTTANYCIPFASTLGFHPHVWRRILQWSTVRDQSRGADGFLRIQPGISQIFQDKILPRPKDMQFLDKMKEQGMAQCLAEVDREFPNLATWEFKSLSVGDDAVMSTIGVRNPFAWVSCDGVSCKKHDIQAGPHESPPDATETPWTIPSDPESQHASRPTVGPRRSDRLRKPDQPSSSNAGQLKGGGDLSGGGDGDDKGKGKGKDTSYESHEELTADKFLQHTWTQAVKYDSTLLCLNSGANEYIGVRHRETQRLFLSDLIKPSECEKPCYGKLHVGLYITAVQDALDRLQQLKQRGEVDQGLGQGLGPVTDPSGSGSGGRKDNFRDGHDRRGSEGSRTGLGGNSGAGKTQGTGKKRKRASGDHQELFDAVRMRKVALIYLSYGIYNSPAPALFVRKEISLSSRLVELGPRPSLSALDRKYHFLPEEYVSMILISEIAEGATGKVHGAKLEALNPDGQVLTADVVVKMATMDEQKERLENEYAIYRHLASKKVDGILDVLGIFNDVEDGGTCLVMTDGGRPLKQGQTLSSVERSAYLHTLEEIHAAGVLHCDIRKQNLLINEFGETAIIDFDQSVRGAIDRGMNRECAQLEKILDSVQKK